MSAPERLECPVCGRDYSALGIRRHLREGHGFGLPAVRDRWPDTHRAMRDARLLRAAERRGDRDRIACRICGLPVHSLGAHLPAAHGIDSREYLRRYPGSPIVSEHMRAIHLDLYADRHGAPYWTPERIVAAMQRWAERTGEPPRRKDWQRSAGRRLLILSGDRPRTSRPNASQVAAVFGSWSAAREAAGFGPPPHTGLRKRCRAGLHDLSDPANVYVYPDGKQRACRPCRDAYTAAWRARRKAA